MPSTSHTTRPAPGQPGTTAAARLLPSLPGRNRDARCSPTSTAAAVLLRDQKRTHVSEIFTSSNTEATASPSQYCNYPLHPTKSIPIPLGYSAGRGALIHHNLSVIPWLPAFLGRNPCPANTAWLLASRMQGLTFDLIKKQTQFICAKLQSPNAQPR